jgi:hypothetical protein
MDDDESDTDVIDDIKKDNDGDDANSDDDKYNIDDEYCIEDDDADEDDGGDIDQDDDDTADDNDDQGIVTDDENSDDQEVDTGNDEDDDVKEDIGDNDDDVDDDNDDDDGCVDKEDDVDDKQDDQQIDEAQPEDVKAITIASDNIPIGITRTGTKFRGVATINDEEQFCGSDGNKPDKGKDSKTWNLNTEKKRRTKKAKGTCHSRLNFRGDEQVTQNTINPKSQSVKHDFATDGKDDHD